MESSRIVLAGLALAFACGGSSGSNQERHPGQTSFESSPGFLEPPGDRTAPVLPAFAVPPETPQAPIHRLEGSRLYLLNRFRGLLVFDVGDIDHPRLIGRSPLQGRPVEMVVRNAVATVVVAEWYGAKEDGTPFHGSLVRSLDATDAANIRVVGEVQLRGWVKDARVVGDVLYTVSGFAGASWDSVGFVDPSREVVVSSLDFFGGTLRKLGERAYASVELGVSTRSAPGAILVASHRMSGTGLTYVDVSDPSGAIVERGSLEIPQHLAPPEFFDGKTARAFATAAASLVSVDFSHPDAPTELPRLALVPLPPTSGTLDSSFAAAFDSGRMYVWSWSHLQLYDLADATRPPLAAELDIPGKILKVAPLGNTLLAVARPASAPDWKPAVVTAVDVTDPRNPTALDIASFGQDWTFTLLDPGVFKPLVFDDAGSLVALPFSVRDFGSFAYRSGFQLLERSSTGSIRGAGLVSTQGWVEGGAFAAGRLLALSDVSLGVVDSSVPQVPQVVSEQPIARNTSHALAMGDFILQLSGDFWGYDPRSTEVRVLPLAEVEEPPGATALSELAIDGWDPRVFRNGSLLYVLSEMMVDRVHTPGESYSRWGVVLHVLDLSDARVRLRSRLVLPAYWPDYVRLPGPGWRNDNAELLTTSRRHDAVQVQGDTLALRIEFEGPDGRLTQLGLFVVDLRDPDAPSVASTTIGDGSTAWGHLVVHGGSLYASEARFLTDPEIERYPRVRYWLDRIDLGDRAHPRVATHVSVPGLLVAGAPAGDPSLLYVNGRRWARDQRTIGSRGLVSEPEVYSLDVLRLHADRAELLGSVDFDGVPGPLLFTGDRALVSVGETYRVESASALGGQYRSQTLQELDVSDPSHPALRVIDPRESRRWLLDLQGDVALFTSGWSGGLGLDVFRLRLEGPRFERFLAAGRSAVSRQGNDLFSASGPWGVQTVRIGP
jgi:hypothetical protein